MRFETTGKVVHQGGTLPVTEVNVYPLPEDEFLLEVCYGAHGIATRVMSWGELEDSKYELARALEYVPDEAGEEPYGVVQRD